MSADSLPRTPAEATPRSSDQTRLDPRKYALHILAVGVILALTIPFLEQGEVFSSDEGAALAQARQLNGEGTWFLPHTMSEIDPEGEFFALEKSTGNGEGAYAPLPKKPLYTLVLAGFYAFGGETAVLALSLAATLGAAAIAGLVAGRIETRAAIPTLWLLGIASPLAIDGLLVIAHTVAAALVALAVLAFVRFLEHPSVRWAFAAVLGLAFAIAVRNEAVLLSMALSATVVTLALRPIRMRRLVLGLATGAFSVLAFLLDAAISRSVFGAGGVSIPAGSEEEIGFVVGRVAGATTTLLAPAYNQGEPLTTLLLVLILILGAYAALVVGSRRSDREIARVVRGVSYMVLVATALRLISRREPDIVPGLLMAFPIGVWGLCLTARMRLRDDRLRLLAAGAGLFVALVLVLQYNEGGGWEWGGRYFAIALPLVGPLAGLGLVRGWERLAESARLPALLATCAVGAVLFVIGVGAVGDTRRLNGDLVDSTLAMTAGMETADEMAVIVSTERELPRLGYAHLDEARWLLAEPELLPDLVELLHESGVEEFVLATLRPREVAASFEQSPYELDRPLNDATEDGNGWWLTVAATR